MSLTARATGALAEVLARLRRSPRYGPLGAPDRLRGWLSPSDLEALGVGLKITGSNGKGSTSHLSAHALAAHGLEVGLYTSPHFLDFTERIQRVSAEGRVSIPADELADVVDEAAARIGATAVTQFEVITLAAALWFRRVGVDAVVWEAGIGGRCDATRAFPSPVAVLTHVALEHTAILGPTVEAIAADKAQLATPGGTLVLGPLPATAAAAARQHTPASTVLSYDASPPPTRLVGAHQRANAGCAAAAVRALLGHSVRDHAIAAGFLSATVPGRFERVREGPPEVWVDAAHDLSGVLVAAEAARAEFAGRPIVLVVGMSADRPVEEMAASLAGLADHVVATTARHRGASAERIHRAFPAGATLTVSTEEAYAEALTVAARLGGVVFATGGLFLAAEIAALARGRGPASLEWT